MTHDHHSHNGHFHGDAAGRIRFAFFLNLGFTIIEILGGLWTNSTAILADALHDLGDSLSLGLAWFLQKISRRRRTPQFSFGYQRFSLLGALINALVLIAGSVAILWQTIPRLQEPTSPNAPGMLAIAVLGILVNGLAVLKLRSGKTLNEQVVSWHLLEDVLGWVAVFIAGVCIWLWDLAILDPLLSLMITAFVLWNVVGKVVKTFKIFLQGTPESLSISSIEDEVRGIGQVRDVHHTHIWSLDGVNHILTTHVVVADGTSREQVDKVKRHVKAKLLKHAIAHATVETEFESDHCNESGGCLAAS